MNLSMNLIHARKLARHVISIAAVVGAASGMQAVHAAGLVPHAAAATAASAHADRDPFTSGSRVAAPDPFLDGARQPEGATVARISNRDGFVADAQIAASGSGTALASISNRDGYVA
ncbi:hypothetical protein CupriaWKF_19715 [Cupriavidus sp. WKF15]|uniref:hypothetical protein n=1 Tax=Cupriavidus sp. WKF15 TaxID=3032282 RepID=UPI0023E3112E|nr:hypothetical protein [Cupriavidus sp. WKF15]WER49380.1 hypothetical protein CupriaWKF_19715 [Cupriavidus sp. WKF15]